MYAARTEYTAVSLPEAHAQIRRLKAELADKDHELQLYLHVAARASDEAERSSHGKLAAEVHDLRSRMRSLQAPSQYPALMPPQPPPPPPQHMMVPHGQRPPAPVRQTPLQGTLAEINYAFDLLDERGDGMVGRWELLRGMMDTPEVRALLRLSTAANQAEVDGLVKAMGSSSSDSVSRHDFECFFIVRELEKQGVALSSEGKKAEGGKEGAAKGRR